ncbi:hypothetical protein ACLOJK_010726 [Asimina triloba]
MKPKSDSLCWADLPSTDSVKTTIERYKKACAESSNTGSVAEANSQTAAVKTGSMSFLDEY